MTATGDEITILQARRRRLAKAINADGTIEPWEGAKTFDFFVNRSPISRRSKSCSADSLSRAPAASSAPPRPIPRA